MPPPLLWSGGAYVHRALHPAVSDASPPVDAMQCGTPVITSNARSLPEVVGDAGIMVDADDADALCQAMLRVYRETSLRERMREASLARAGLFSRELCTARTLAAYRAALSS